MVAQGIISFADSAPESVLERSRTLDPCMLLKWLLYAAALMLVGPIFRGVWVKSSARRCSRRS